MQILIKVTSVKKATPTAKNQEFVENISFVIEIQL